MLSIEKHSREETSVVVNFRRGHGGDAARNAADNSGVTFRSRSPGLLSRGLLLAQVDLPVKVNGDRVKSPVLGEYGISVPVPV